MIFDFTKKKEEQPGRKTDAAVQNPGKKRRLREGAYTRYRDCQIAFHVTKEEKEMALKRFQESRFDKFQNYAIDALIHPMPDDETIKDYAFLEEKLDKLYVQLRGMATNSQPKFVSDLHCTKLHMGSAFCHILSNAFRENYSPWFHLLID